MAIKDKERAMIIHIGEANRKRFGKSCISLIIEKLELNGYYVPSRSTIVNCLKSAGIYAPDKIGGWKNRYGQRDPSMARTCGYRTGSGGLAAAIAPAPEDIRYYVKKRRNHLSEDPE